MKISIILEALTGNFETDMARAAGISKKRMREIENNVKETAKLIGGAMALAAGAIGAALLHAAKQAEEFGKASQKIGVSVETYSRLAYTANIAGVSLDQLQTSVAKLVKFQVAAAQGNLEAAGTFKAFGIAVKDSNGNLRDTQSVLRDWAQVFKSLPDGPAKTALALRVFGKAGEEMIPMLNLGAAGMKQMADNADRLGATLDTQTVRRVTQLSEKFKDLKTELGGLASAILADLLPDIIELTNWFEKNYIQGVNLKETAHDVATGVRDIVTAAQLAIESIQAMTSVTIGLYNALSGLSKLNPAAFIANWAQGGTSIAENFAAAGREMAAVKTLHDTAMQQGRDVLNGQPPAVSNDYIPGSAGGPTARYAHGADVKHAKELAAATHLLTTDFAANAAAAKAAAAEQKRLAEQAARAQKAFQDDIDRLAASMGGEYAKANTEYQMSLRDIAEEYKKGGATAAQYAKQQSLLKQQFDLVAAGIKAGVEGPIAQALFDYQQALKKLRADAIATGVGEKELSASEKLLTRDFERNTKSIKDQLDPLTALDEEMKFELDLLGKTNAERVVANALRKAELGMSDKEIAAFEKENAAKIQSIKTDELKIESQQKLVSAMDDFRSSLEDNIAGVLSGTESISQAFKNMATEIIAQIAKMIAQQWVEKLFGQQGTTGGGSMGGGWLSSIFSMFSSSGAGGGGGGMDFNTYGFGGIGPPGHAFGGPVSAGMPYLVGEQGPELMIPQTSGTIIPHHKLGAVGAGVNQNNNFYLSAPTEPRTQQQIASRIGFETQRARARNAA